MHPSIDLTGLSRSAEDSLLKGELMQQVIVRGVCDSKSIKTNTSRNDGGKT